MTFESIPATSPIGGPFWTLVVPAILFSISFTATLLLYRHFAGRPGGDK